jgi:hypothetical protein
MDVARVVPDDDEEPGEDVELPAVVGGSDEE